MEADDRRAFITSSTINATTPNSSLNTPALLTHASTLTPTALSAVVITLRPQPRATALTALSCGSAGSPTIWKTFEICGAALCSASATAESVTTRHATYTQPVIHPTNGDPTSFAH